MSASFSLRQPSFPGLCPVTEAIDTLANSGGVEERGAFFTRREVVDFILDLTGYTADQPLHLKTLLEPSFGDGGFLLPAIDRLLTAWKRSNDTARPVEVLGRCIRAVELHRETYSRTRGSIIEHLRRQGGIPLRSATSIADCWLISGDFLLADLPTAFDVVIGNPPYVRTELIPDVLMAQYRERYTTIYDRADLYIPFIERSLRSLKEGGALGFICADRWMKNRYGGPLRALVSSQFHLKFYIDMTDTPAFHADVIAYPAVTVITREKPSATRIAHRPPIEHEALAALARSLTSTHRPDAIPAPKKGAKPATEDTSRTAVRELAGVTAGAEPWILESSDQMALVRRLEGAFPAIEEAGCKVGIGVATGADSAYIGKMDALDVEPSRKLPLVMTRDILSGEVAWRGYGVINPFADAGGLVDLEQFPKLRRHLEARRAELVARHCAQKMPDSWYRTIDRITPSLAKKPKLLIPDIKGEAQIVYEAGDLYPHHNLYYITADRWDLHALQAVLLSGIARLFVAIYSTKMRGGYLRFQAQYLRRIRIPHWEEVSPKMREALRQAGINRDLAACNSHVFALYNLSPAEMAALGGGSE